MSDAMAELIQSLPQSDRQRREKLLSMLPSGESAESLSEAELARALKKMNVPGESAADYRRFLQEIWDDAGETAIVLWHLDHEPDSGQSPDNKKDIEDDE